MIPSVNKRHDVDDVQTAIRVGLETHLARIDDLVGGRISVIDLSRRNHAHAVVVKDGPSYFIKQPTNRTMAESVRNEASVYQLLHRLSPSDEGMALAPRFHAFHEDSDALILEYLPGVCPLSTYRYERRRPLKWVARSLGRMIAQLHNITHEISTNPSVLQETISSYAPPVFYLLTPSVSMYCMLSPANLQLLQELQDNQRLQEQVEAARKQWSPSCLVHGDLKWDNVLVCPPCPPARSRALRIADWELAGVGDPAWDVASVLAAYISAWIRAEQLVSTRIPSRPTAPPDMSALCRTYWDAYAEDRRLTAHEAGVMLRRAIAYCGMKLIWVAIEGMQESRMLSATYLTHVQVGLNVLERPEEAVVYLCGLSCATWPATWPVPPTADVVS